MEMLDDASLQSFAIEALGEIGELLAISPLVNLLETSDLNT